MKKEKEYWLLLSMTDEDGYTHPIFGQIVKKLGNWLIAERYDIDGCIAIGETNQFVQPKDGQLVFDSITDCGDYYFRHHFGKDYHENGRDNAWDEFRTNVGLPPCSESYYRQRNAQRSQVKTN